MMEPPDAEFTIISIDNSRRVLWSKTLLQAQVEATKLYCETVLECNPDNLVTILTMSTRTYGELVPATSDLKKLLLKLQFVPCDFDGGAEFDPALYMACQIFSRSPSHMKRRLLMFVGGPIHLSYLNVSSYGKKLKDIGVALDVFNLFHLEIDRPPLSYSVYHYARKELETLVATANDRGSCRIVDTVELSICCDLSRYTLKEHLHYLGQKAAADGKNKSTADEKNKSAEEIMPLVKQMLFYNENPKSAAEMMNMVKQADVAAGRKKKVRKVLKDKNTKSGAEMINKVKQVDVAAGRKKRVKKAQKESWNVRVKKTQKESWNM